MPSFVYFPKWQHPVPVTLGPILLHYHTFPNILLERRHHWSHWCSCLWKPDVLLMCTFAFSLLLGTHHKKLEQTEKTLLQKLQHSSLAISVLCSISDHSLYYCVHLTFHLICRYFWNLFSLLFDYNDNRLSIMLGWTDLNQSNSEKCNCVLLLSCVHLNLADSQCHGEYMAGPTSYEVPVYPHVLL